jgi:PAS domain S-box-containing protein
MKIFRGHIWPSGIISRLSQRRLASPGAMQPPVGKSLHQINTELETILLKKTREALASEQRFRSLIENGSELITLLDRQYNPLYRSPASIRLTGWTHEERREIPTTELVHPDDRAALTEAFQKAASDPGKTYSVEFRALHKAGHYIWLKGSMIDLLEDESVRAIVINMHDITESKVAEALLKASYEELRLLAGHLQDIREEERTNMAREIHDELGQQLTGIKMDISWLNRRPDLNDKVARDKIRSVLELVDGTVNTVRRLAAELRPSILDDLGLAEALEWHSRQFERRSGVRISFIQFGEKQPVPSLVATGLFRIYQEALTNVARHAGASSVTAVLDSDEKNVVLTISDDGKGFDAMGVESKKTLGLLGMKERALMMGARYEFTSQPGHGTMIQVAVPIP